VKTPRFSLRILLLVVTAVCLAIGYARFQQKRIASRSAFYRRAASSISLAFDKTPPGCEPASLSWPGQEMSEFDRTDYSAWQRELSAESRLYGTHQAAFYKITSAESDLARLELARVLLDHFGKRLLSMGFVISNHGPMAKIALGHQVVVTLIHPETELELHIRFVFGRKGFTFVAIDMSDESPS
jgi:hypothetical protein